MMLARILIRTIKTKERTQAPISAIPIIHQVSLRSRNAHSPNCWKLRKWPSLYTAVLQSFLVTSRPSMVSLAGITTSSDDDLVSALVSKLGKHRPSGAVLGRYHGGPYFLVQQLLHAKEGCLKLIISVHFSCSPSPQFSISSFLSLSFIILITTNSAS